MKEIRKPYLLFLGDAVDTLAAKTASGIAYWRPDWCIGQLRFSDCKVDLGISDLTLEEAREKGAATLVVGVATRGGYLPPSWIDAICRALELGYDIANGLHQRLSDIKAIAIAAQRAGRHIFEVRRPMDNFPLGTGLKRSGHRLLTVGTDCSVGKMFTALALERELKIRGFDATFRATGQTGVLIAGSGYSIDAVIADFAAGAAEYLSPAAASDHWDLIEGQGSLFHASYAGVSLALLHGSQPDAIVLCHEPTRTHMRGLPHFPLPDLAVCLGRNIELAKLTNPNVQCIGISLNTIHLDVTRAKQLLKSVADQFAVPATDPVRFGVEGIAKSIEALSLR